MIKKIVGIQSFIISALILFTAPLAAQALKLGGMPEQLVIDPKRQFAYILDSTIGKAGLWVIDLPNFKIVKRVELQGRDNRWNDSSKHTPIRLTMWQGRLLVLMSSYIPQEIDAAERSKDDVDLILDCGDLSPGAHKIRSVLQHGKEVNDYSPTSPATSGTCLVVGMCNTIWGNPRCSYLPGSLLFLEAQADGLRVSRSLQLPVGKTEGEFLNPSLVTFLEAQTLLVGTGYWQEPVKNPGDEPKLCPGRIALYEGTKTPDRPSKVFEFPGAPQKLAASADYQTLVVTDGNAFGNLYLMNRRLDPKAPGAITPLTIGIGRSVSDVLWAGKKLMILDSVEGELLFVSTSQLAEAQKSEQERPLLPDLEFHSLTPISTKKLADMTREKSTPMDMELYNEALWIVDLGGYLIRADLKDDNQQKK